MCCYSQLLSLFADNKGPRKVFLPNKLLECLPRLSGLPNERLRWNTNEVRNELLDDHGGLSDN